MKWLRQQLEAAGLSRFSPFQAIISSLGASVAISSWVQLSFGVVGLSLFAFLAVIGFAIEGLSIAATTRS